MARPKKSTNKSRTSSLKTEVKNSSKVQSRFVWKENYAGFILGAIILVAIGILVANYFVKSTNTVSDIKTDISNVKQAGKSVTVEAGESLSSIAKRELGDANLWPLLVEENKLNSTTVEIGQTLRIPESSTPTATVSKPAATVTPSASKTDRNEAVTKPESIGSEYTVVEGDTLWEIAQSKYSDPTRWVEIAKLNNVKNNSLGNPLIYAGSSIKLP